jgi:DNA-directed RNA polymerase subunit N
MIIPVRCYTCGNLLGNKYAFFCRERNQRTDKKIQYFDANNKDKTDDAICLDKLGLSKICCRNVMLSHVDIEI